MTTLTAFPSPAELRGIERAAAHAVHESALSPEARFRDGVTDLDVARVLRAVESGVRVVQPRGLGYRWAGLDLGPGKLTVVVREMIRTGLAENRDGLLVPAKVHLDAGDRTPACGGTKALRHRTHADLALVDCLGCVS